MSAYLNIAGQTPVDDPEYRYKMPRIITKIEGRGNGIKTLVANCNDIAFALHRSTGEVNKFFGCELGAQSKYDEKTDRALVNGAFDSTLMQQHLSKYIELFVLCPNCRLPETKYKFKGQLIYHKCYACGAVEPIDMNHRLTTFILKEHASLKRQTKKEKDSKKEEKKLKKLKKSKQSKTSDTAADDDETNSTSSSAIKDEEAPKKEKKTKKHHKKKSPSHHGHGHGKDISNDESNEEPIEKEIEEEEDNVTWHTDLSNEAVAQRKHEAEMLEPKSANGIDEQMDSLTIKEDENTIETAITATKNYLNEKDHSMNEIIEEVISQQTLHGLSTMDRLTIFIYAAFDQNIIAQNQIKKYANVVQHLAYDMENQCILFGLLEEFCYVKFPALAGSFPIVLKLFYDEDALEEETILLWNERRASYERPSMSAEQKERAVASMKPLVEWLKNAEEEESDEDEEDEE